MIETLQVRRRTELGRVQQQHPDGNPYQRHRQIHGTQLNLRLNMIATAFRSTLSILGASEVPAPKSLHHPQRAQRLAMN